MKNPFALLLAISASGQAAPLPEVERSNIEYESPAEALEALRSKPEMQSKQEYLR